MHLDPHSTSPFLRCAGRGGCTGRWGSLHGGRGGRGVRRGGGAWNNAGHSDAVPGEPKMQTYHIYKTSDAYVGVKDWCVFSYACVCVGVVSFSGLVCVWLSIHPSVCLFVIHINVPMRTRQNNLHVAQVPFWMFGNPSHARCCQEARGICNGFGPFYFWFSGLTSVLVPTLVFSAPSALGTTIQFLWLKVESLKPSPRENLSSISISTLSEG